jgi:hypothetical protein
MWHPEGDSLVMCWGVKYSRPGTGLLKSWGGMVVKSSGCRSFGQIGSRSTSILLLKKKEKVKEMYLYLRLDRQEKRQVVG